jgi:hypothetical protein
VSILAGTQLREMKLLTALYYYQAAASIWLLLSSSPSLCHGAPSIRSAATTTARDQGHLPLRRALPQGIPDRTGGRLLGGFTLINAITDTKVDFLMDGTVIDVSSIPNMPQPAFNINATFLGNATGNRTIGFVQYGYNTTANHRIEYTAPYAFCGNNRNDFFVCSKLGYGIHTVSVTPFNDKGIALGLTRTVTFTIVPRTLPPVPTVPLTLAPVPTAPSTLRPTPTPFPTQAPDGPNNSPPKLQRLTATSSLTVNVTKQSSMVEFIIVIQDFGSPLIGSGYIELRHPQGASISSVPFAVKQATTNRLLNFTVRLPIPRYIAPGAYPLYMQVMDGIDTLYYTRDTLQALSFPFQVVVVNSGPDRTPPKLLNFTALTPMTINVTNGPATAKFRFTVSDNASGFKSLLLSKFTVNGGGFGYYYLDQQDDKDRTPVSFNFDFPLTVYETTVTYQLRVQIYDEVDNVIEYDASALAKLGFPSSLNIVNANAPDYAPPFVVGVKALSSTTVDVSAGPRTVNIQVVVQDNISGFQYGEVWLLDPTTNTNITSSAFAPAVARAGMPLTFNVTVRVPRYVPAQAYIFQFFLSDVRSNIAAQIDFGGATYFPIQVINSIVDVTPPTLLNFSLSPRTVDPTTGTSSITFTLVVRDDLSGIRRDERCFITIESVGPSFYQSYHYFPKSDTPGLGRQTIAIKASFDETFEWSETYSLDLRFADAALNTVRFTPRALVQRGFAGFLPTIS